MDIDLFDIASSHKDKFQWNNQPYKKNAKGIILPDTEVISLHSGWADMFFYYADREKYTLFINFYDVRQRRQTRVRSDTPSVEFTMMLLNQIYNELDGLKGTELMQSFFNITYLPFVDSIVQFEAGQVYCTLDIHLKDCFLQELLRDFPTAMEPLMNSVEQMVAKRIFASHVPTTIFMSEIAGSIVRNMAKGKRFLPLVDKDVEALIAHAVSYDMEVSLPILEMERRHLLNEVYKRIMADPAVFPTIKELCKIANMNATTLNNLFKGYFSMPMKQSWSKFRMDKARYMLAHDREKKINEIAREVGYGCVENFTKAFKAYFKKPPSHFRTDMDDFDPIFQANL